MTKIYIIVNSGAGQVPLPPFASSIAKTLRDKGFKKVRTEHGEPSERTAQFHMRESPKFVLSEHYTAHPIAFASGEIVRTFTEADQRIRPPLNIFTGTRLLGIAVVGPVNSGKSWIIRMIEEMLHERFGIRKQDILEEYVSGTWGWPGRSEEIHVSDNMNRIREEVEIDVRVLESPLRGRLGDQLSLTD